MSRRRCLYTWHDLDVVCSKSMRTKMQFITKTCSCGNALACLAAAGTYDANVSPCAGIAQADDVASPAIDKLLAADGKLRHPNNTWPEVGEQPIGSRPSAPGEEAAWKLCHLTNISVCATTVEATRDDVGFSVALWNPLGRSRDYFLRIPITTSGKNTLWSVTGTWPPHCLSPVCRLLDWPLL